MPLQFREGARQDRCFFPGTDFSKKILRYGIMPPVQVHSFPALTDTLALTLALALASARACASMLCQSSIQYKYRYAFYSVLYGRSTGMNSLPKTHEKESKTTASPSPPPSASPPPLPIVVCLILLLLWIFLFVVVLPPSAVDPLFLCRRLILVD